MRQGRFILSVLFFWALPTLASDLVGSGRVAGRVTDECGRGLARALVTITGSGAVGRYVALTDDAGSYSIPGVPLREPLVVRASYAGRIPVIYSGLLARTGFGTRRDFRLRPADMHEFLIVVSPGWNHYEAVVAGIEESIRGQVTMLELMGDELQDTRSLRAALEAVPNGVFTIGRLASHLARHEAKAVPVVHAVVPDPMADDLLASNMCGIALNGGFSKAFDRLLAIRPEASTVGTIYDPRRLAPAIHELRETARQKGISLEVQAVRSSGEIEAALEELGAASLDAFLLLLDPALLDQEALPTIGAFVRALDLVYIVPDEAFLDEWGTLTYSTGLRAMGVNAGITMTNIIACGVEPQRLGVAGAP